MREGFSHDQVVVPYKVNGVSGLDGHILTMSISFIDLCNGVKYGMWVSYNLIQSEPAKSESKLT